MSARFFLVIANRFDLAARKFVAGAGSQARLMTPSDISQPGWSFRLGDVAASVAVVAGEQVPATAIAGVLTRLPGVTIDDLPHIVASDRAYIAAEMTAFLLAWLTSLKCPVVNPPTPQCLSGPMWRQEQWVAIANRLAIPVKPVVRRVSRVENATQVRPSPALATITVVGRKHLAVADRILVKRSHALAEAAGTDLLSVQFDGAGADANFVTAGLWPDLGDKKIAKAVMELMRTKAGLAANSRKTDDFALGHFAG
jgi:hypothetical protein